MAGEKYYTQIPPSSTGDRIELKHSAEVPYTNRTGTILVDEHVHLGTSGIECHVQLVQEITSTTGWIRVHYDQSAVFNNIVPIPGEIIYDHHGNVLAQVATVQQAYDLYTNVNVITSYENSAYGLSIDPTGSANVRFSEGLPQLDAFGKLRTSGATILGEYVFSNSYLPQYFSTRLLNNGQISWDPNNRAALLQTTTAAGDLVAHTSNTYHHYVPGSSQLFMCTLALGDTGKPGLGRSWGMFDFQNGFHFVHREDPANPGQIKLGIVIKSDVTGSVVDTYVWQEEWNGDKLDGTGPSKMIIDVSKDNLYWIDVQWLGAGRVRFGVYHDGQRLVCHEYYHDNRYPYPVSATGSLPACFAQRNFTVTGSSSEMRVFCTAVWTETSLNIPALGSPDQRSVSHTITANDTYEYMATMAPIELYTNGRINRSLYFPVELEVMAYDTVTGEKGLVEVEVLVEPVLSNLNFIPAGTNSTVEYDTTASWYGGGAAIFKMFVTEHENGDLTNIYNNLTSGAVKNYAEFGGTRTETISNVTQTNPAVITTSDSTHRLREGFPFVISGVSGMTQLNGNTYYMRITGPQTAELYTNAALTIPVDATGFTPYSSGGIMKGNYGTQFYWTLICKKLFGTNPVKVIAKVGWKEINQ